MRPRSRRKTIRELARRATEKAHPPEGKEAAAPPPAPPTVHEMACICGQLLRLKSTLDEQRCGCPACGRKFLATFTPDPRTGKSILCPVYLDDSKEATGDTYIVDVAANPAAAASSKGALDEFLGPEPPPQLAFACPCGRKLMALREVYDRRVKCPQCGGRMLITLSYDPQAKRFTLNPVRITDAPSGDTWIAGHE